MCSEDDSVFGIVAKQSEKLFLQSRMKIAFRFINEQERRLRHGNGECSDDDLRYAGANLVELSRLIAKLNMDVVSLGYRTNPKIGKSEKA